MIGAYTTALLDHYWHVPLAVGIPAALVSTALLGWVLGKLVLQAQRPVPLAHHARVRRDRARRDRQLARVHARRPGHARRDADAKPRRLLLHLPGHAGGGRRPAVRDAARPARPLHDRASRRSGRRLEPRHRRRANEVDRVLRLVRALRPRRLALRHLQPARQPRARPAAADRAGAGDGRHRRHELAHGRGGGRDPGLPQLRVDARLRQRADHRLRPARDRLRPLPAGRAVGARRRQAAAGPAREPAVGRAPVGAFRRRRRGRRRQLRPSRRRDPRPDRPERLGQDDGAQPALGLSRAARGPGADGRRRHHRLAGEPAGAARRAADVPDDARLLAHVGVRQPADRRAGARHRREPSRSGAPTR